MKLNINDQIWVDGSYIDEKKSRINWPAKVIQVTDEICKVKCYGIVGERSIHLPSKKMSALKFKSKNYEKMKLKGFGTEFKDDLLQAFFELEKELGEIDENQLLTDNDDDMPTVTVAQSTPKDILKKIKPVTKKKAESFSDSKLRPKKKLKRASTISAMTSSFSDSDDMSPTINNTLAVGTSVLAKFKGCGLKYFPARIIQIKDNSYVVEFYSHHTRKVSRKDLILTTDPSFTTCDIPEEVYESFKKDENFRDDEIAQKINVFKKDLDDIIMQKSFSKRANLFYNGGKDRQNLGNQVGHGIFNDNEYDFILRYLREIFPASDYVDRIDDFNTTRHLSFLSLVILPETILRLISVAEDCTMEQAELVMMDLSRSNWANGLLAYRDALIEGAISIERRNLKQLEAELENKN